MSYLLISLLIILPVAVFAQSIHQVDTDLSSEWEATGFNNGRAFVRDADGFFHIVYHTQDNPDSAPGGFCDIWYSHTLIPAPPTMSADWAPAVKIVNLPGDDRYPSIGIYHGSSGVANDIDWLHVVWQHCDPGGVYDIFFCSCQNALVPPPDTWTTPIPLYTSPLNSLVPDIDVSLGNGLHVVWQEEDVDPFSEIFYSRSVNNGVNWGPVLNISNTPGANSQMPDIATIIDFWGAPSHYTYYSNVLHVVWNDDIDTSSPPPHIFYTSSPDAGATWPTPFEDVTLLSGAAGLDGYPSLTVDRDDIPHVAWMTELWAHDPNASGPYTPGLDPTVLNSFPGPDPGMYGSLVNSILYSWRPAGVWSNPFETVSSGSTDDEFPSIAVDPYNNLWIGYQMWDGFDYEIGGATKAIGTPPPWSLGNLSTDPGHDDLFPSTATKKAGTSTAGYDVIWTKIDMDGSAGGHFPPAALSPAHGIWFTGNTTYISPVAIGDSPEGILPGDFFVYPNPVLTGAWIFTGESSGLIKIFDLSGRVVFRETVMPENNGNCFWGAIDSNGTPIPNGHYIVTLQNGDLLETRSIIVAR